MKKMNYDKLLSPNRHRLSSKRATQSDMRSAFEKDYHRIIGSASFRRLQDKTQVFPLDKSDFVRTRLTHSLEVSSIAKSLGQTTGMELHKQGLISADQAQAMADILLCAGLIHDIGNPPFGHFGENVIREWFREKLDILKFKDKTLRECLNENQIADLCNFEGNAQSLRVVTRLHHLVDDKGMNLTKALLNTIIKYPISSSEIDKAAGDIRLKKMGYFTADEKLFKDITEDTGALNMRHPLTFLLEAADDIAYSSADLEDGFKKGILSYNRLLTLLKNNRFAAEYSEKPEYKDLAISINNLERLYNVAISENENKPEQYAVQNWVVSLQVILIEAVCKSFIEKQELILNGEYKNDLFHGTSSELLIKVLKETAFNHVFQDEGIVKLEIAASKIISTLLNEFVDAAIVFDTDCHKTEKQEKLMQLISSNYMRIYYTDSEGKDEFEKLYLRMLLVTDCISGMTDHYAKALYQDISGIY